MRRYENAMSEIEPIPPRDGFISKSFYVSRIMVKDSRHSKEEDVRANIVKSVKD
jgi:hypothetical protein